MSLKEPYKWNAQCVKRMVQEITDSSQIPKDGKVILDFYATWCGPCKRVAPVYIELAGYFQSISFFKVDVEEAQTLSEEFSIESLPTFVLMHNGKIVKRIEGANIDAVLSALKELKAL